MTNASLIKELVLARLPDKYINDNSYLWNAEALIRILIGQEYPHLSNRHADRLTKAVWEDLDARRDNKISNIRELES